MAKRKQTEYIQGHATHRRTEGDYMGVLLDAVTLAEKTGHTWSEWVATELVGKPVGIGAASWLRVRCLIHSTQGA